MAKIVIIGAGAMGTAFAYPCIDNNHDVSVVGTYLENKSIEQLKNNSFHSSLNVEVSKSIKFFKHESITDLFKIMPDLVIIGVSSKGIEWVSEELKKISKDGKLPKLLMLTKGLSIFENNYELLVEKLERLFSNKNIKKINLSVVGGPCLASGLAKRVHSSVIIANKDIDRAKILSKMLSTDYYHVSASSDLNGVEVCAAIKNIFSMIIGAAPGLNKIKSQGNFYLNTSAALLKQSIYEMEIFVEHLKGKKETVKGLAGLGDLYVSSGGGRNAKMGAYIGEGLTFSKAKKTKMEKVTVEGADLAKVIGKKINQDFDEKTLPLMLNMINAIVENRKLYLNWELFR